MPNIEIDPELCTKCGTCATNCPVGIFQQEDEDSIPTIQGEGGCIFCAQCVDNCPADAVKHDDFS